MKKLLQICLVLSLWLLVSAQTPCHGKGEYNHITAEKGLKGRSVYKFYKDSQGLMWVGHDLGVCSFDGLTVIGYDPGCVPPASIVKDFAETAAGDILFCCQNGLYRVDQDKQRCGRINPEIQKPTALCHTGKQLFIGSRHGLWLYRPGKQARRIPFETPSSKDETVNDLLPDGQGGLWIATNTHVFHLDPDTRETRRHDMLPESSGGQLSALAMADSVLYAGTMGQGILFLDTRTGEKGSYDADIRCTVVPDLFAGRDGRLYVATDGNGAFVIDTGKRAVVTHLHNGTGGNHIPSNAVYTIWKDEQLDICWLGFFRQGFLYDYHVHPFIATYSHGDFDTHGLPVRSFALHGRDMAIGTTEGLYFHKGGSGETLHFPPGNGYPAIITDIEHFGGRFVLATFGDGLYTFDPETGTLSNTAIPTPLTHGRFGKLTLYPGGHVLAALGDIGVFFLDGELRVIRAFTAKNSELGSSYWNDCLFDREGKGWMSSMDGMALYNPATGNIQARGFPEGFFNKKGELSFNLCRNGDILAFSRDNVWRTKPDLSRVVPIDIYARTGVKQLQFIVEMPDSGFCVGSEQGLFLFDKDFQNFRHIGKSEGLPSLEFNKQEVLWTGDTLWMATNGGLTFFTTESYRHTVTRQFAPTIISRLETGSATATPSDLYRINKDKRIDLTWELFPSDKRNGLRLTPVGLDYGNPQKGYFEWALDDGQYLATCEIVECPTLMIGKHVLKLRAAGYPSSETRWTIRVFPSATFCAGAAALLLALSLVPYALRLHRRRRRFRELLRRKHALDMQIAKAQAVQAMQMEEYARQEAKAQALYQKARLDEKEYADLLQTVEAYMEKEKPYTNADFRISNLAQAIGQPAAYLSQMFNRHTGKTFYDFVNDYRIKEFKRRIEDPAYAQFTLTATSESCGFKRSTFFTVFKKHEGCTPNEYLQRNRVER